MIEPDQVLPLRVGVYNVAMAMKGYPAFSKAPTLLEPHHQLTLCHIQDTRSGMEGLPLYRDEGRKKGKVVPL